MEIFDRLFCSPTGEMSDDDISTPGGSFLRQPLPGLDSPSQSFAEVYGPGGQLLAHMADIAETGDKVQLADLLRQISELVNDPDFEPEPKETRAARLVEFVYPVV